jgi:hypothetical protein
MARRYWSKMLDALRRWPEQARFDVLVGPLMASGERRRLAAMLPSEAPVRRRPRRRPRSIRSGRKRPGVPGRLQHGLRDPVLRPAGIIVPREMIGGVADREALRARMLEQRGLATSSGSAI